ADGGIEGAALVRLPLAGVNVRGLVSWHSTPGAYLLPQEQRGPIDVPAESEGGVGALSASVMLDEATQVSFGGSYSKDRYVNGIEASLSRTRVADASAGLVHDGGEDTASWELHAYLRDQ